MSRRNHSAKKNSHSQSESKQVNAQIIDSDNEKSPQIEEVKNINGSAKNMSKKRALDQISNSG